MKILLASLVSSTVIVASSVVRVFAHEVYVLDGDEVEAAKREPMLDIFGVVAAHPWQFLAWAFGIAVLIAVVYRVSTDRCLEKALDPVYDVLKKYAPHVAQATLGLSMLACAMSRALFGVELPFSYAFYGFEDYAQLGIAVVGAMLVSGLAPRTASAVVVALYVWFSASVGLYMLNYGMFLGTAAAFLVYGAGYDVVALSRRAKRVSKARAVDRAERRFLFIRVAYGASIVFAALYAKLFYGGLALQTVEKYSLTQIFPFDASFIVLGALFVELIIGACVAFGFESRFASLAALVFLSVSMAFFGEAVWPHVIVFGTAASIFMYGYDRHCLSVKMGKASRWDPVL